MPKTLVTLIFTLIVTLGLSLGLSTAHAQVLTITDWPVAPMPSEAEQNQDPGARTYATILQGWLDANPEVTLESIEFDIWTQEALITAIAGGSAPAAFPGQVLGGWDPTVIRSAFAQDLAADVTEMYERYDFAEKMVEPLPELWQQSWALEGNYYALPVAFGVNQGVFYRKDLVEELGLEEPQPGWTWDDFRELAGALTTETRRGAAVPLWIPARELTTNGLGWMSSIPAPETAWNWQADYTSNMDLRRSIIERWRTAIHDDQSILIDPGLDDQQIPATFIRGDAAMLIQDASYYARPPTDPMSMSQLADSLDRPLEEVVGWVELPRGELDTLSTTGNGFFIISFDPDLNSDQLDKAVSLFEYMYYGEGAVLQAQANYEQHQDLRYVYSAVVPIDGRTQVPGVPGSIADAWGEAFMARIDSAINVPQPPLPSAYFPPETEAGPSSQAFDDALEPVSKLC